MSDELDKGELSPAEQEEVRVLLLAIRFYFEQGGVTDRKRMPPDMRQKFDRLFEILGPLVNLIRDDPEQ